MKDLLLDQGLPRSTVDFLRRAGTNSVHVGDLGMSRATDRDILEYARQRGLIVVTLDADFHMLLGITNASAPSVIRLRQQRLKAEHAAEAIQFVLARGRELLESGAVASATKNLVRFRKLPLGFSGK